MRVWLDDERPMPGDFDVHVKTADEAINLLKTGNVRKISLDFMLDPEGCHGYGNGMEVAVFIAQAVAIGDIPPLEAYVHTSNKEMFWQMKGVLGNNNRAFLQRERA